MAFLSADIPLYKLTDPVLKSFLENYTKRPIPAQSTLRQSYISKCYEKTIIKIRDELKDDKIWVSIDETTDSSGRFIANVVVGPLRKEPVNKSFLLTSEQLQQTNHSSIAKLFTESLNLL